MIATGGMGEVYRGHNIQTGDPVAIKPGAPRNSPATRPCWRCCGRRRWSSITCLTTRSSATKRLHHRSDDQPAVSRHGVRQRPSRSASGCRQGPARPGRCAPDAGAVGPRAWRWRTKRGSSTVTCPPTTSCCRAAMSTRPRSSTSALPGRPASAAARCSAAVSPASTTSSCPSSSACSAGEVTERSDISIAPPTVALPSPVVFVVDDAHRLDEASDVLFAAMGLRVAGRPWLLVGLHWRDHATFVDDIEESIVVDVGPLSAAESAAMARAAVEGDDRFDEEALADLIDRGVSNPLFLLELVRSGIGKGSATPGSIEALITARIDTLTASDRLLLRGAAVLGSVIDINLLAESTGNSLDLRRRARWESLGGFLTHDAGNVFRFHKPCIGRAAYQGLSFRRRRQLHGDVAHVLERRAGEDGRAPPNCSRCTTTKRASGIVRGDTRSSPATGPGTSTRTPKPPTSTAEPSRSRPRSVPIRLRYRPSPRRWPMHSS